MANAVLVVDMVRGFCEEGGNLYTGESARKIIPVVHGNSSNGRVGKVARSSSCVTITRPMTWNSRCSPSTVSGARLRRR